MQMVGIITSSGIHLPQYWGNFDVWEQEAAQITCRVGCTDNILLMAPSVNKPQTLL